LHAWAVSGDLQWLAISNRSRGAIWNLTQNVRTQYVRSFDGAWLSPSGIFYVDFPKYEEKSRAIAELSPTATTNSIAYKLDDIVARQEGGFLQVTTPKEKSITANCDIEIRDIVTNKPVWSRHFPHEVPSIRLNSFTGTALLGWWLGETGGRDELQAFSDLKGQATKEDYLFEVVDLHSGAVTGKVLVKTNHRSLRLEGSGWSGDWVVVSAEGNQSLVYSLSNGAERGHFFGTAAFLLGHAGLLGIEKDSKELDLYNLNTQELRRRYVFADPIVLSRTSADGTQLLVLTTKQTAYFLDTTKTE
jgi:hypothetical protein